MVEWWDRGRGRHAPVTITVPRWLAEQIDEEATVHGVSRDDMAAGLLAIAVSYDALSEQVPAGFSMRLTAAGLAKAKVRSDGLMDGYARPHLRANGKPKRSKTDLVD